MSRTAFLIAVLLLLGLGLIALPGTALATTYYFSTSGADGNTGLDTTHPKQTLTTAATLMLPGNTICLKRDDVWYETTTWSITDKIGTSSQPIVIQDYGTGAKPVIAHFDRIIGGWTKDGSSQRYYHATRLATVMRCLVNGVGKKIVANKSSVTDSTKYYVGSGNVYVYGDPGTTPVELAPCTEKTYLQNCSYMTWQNLEFRGGGNNSVTVEAPTDHLTFDSCDIRKAGCYALYFKALGGKTGTTQDTHISPYVHNCYINKDWNAAENLGDPGHDDYGDGISFATAEGGVIRGNTVIDQGHASIMLLAESTQQYGTHNCLVELNETSQPIVEHGYSLNIEGNEGKCTGNVVRRNYFHDNPTGNQIGGDHNFIYSNIFQHSRPDAFATGQGACMTIANYQSGGGIVNHHNTYVNNTIYDGTENAIHQCWCDTEPDDPSSNVFKNNLIVKWSEYGVRQETSAYPTSQVWQHNCFWQPGGSTSTPVLYRDGDGSYTVAQADAAFTGWANNLQVDPLFVNSNPTVPSDFELSSSSPVKAAGTPITGISGFVDYDGNAWDANHPSMGAFQYLGAGSPPVANFTGNPTSGYAPLAVAFTDTSTNTPTSWSWNFGDSGTSTTQSPSHTYSSTGSFTVSLRATNSAGYDDEVKTNYITASTPPSPPVAAFSGTPTSGSAPLVVAFTDSSTNSPTSWSWDFGDSSTSTVQHPSHTYGSAGNYTVSLRATNAGGYDDEVKTNYISVSASLAPTFVAAGAVAANAAAITPALPAGIAANDILLLFLETRNQAVTIANQNGGTWTEVTNSPQGSGTTDGTRLTAFWSRYNGTQGAPTTSDSGNHQLGRIVAVRGCATSGNPWDVTAGGVEATSDTSGSIPGATTTVANTLVVAAIATSLPDANGTANFSAWANANLTGVAEQTDNTSNVGNGGGLGVATGVKAAAGAYGNTTVTCGTAAVKGMMSIALKATGGGGSAPVAAFSGTPTSGPAPLSVSFTDSSTNSPTSWSWNFGDSSTSTAPNPSHTFAAGTYTVSLRATNAYGYDDEVKTNYITATGSFTLSASPSTVAPGNQITVNWTAPSSPHGDLWVFMVAAGAPNNEFLSSPASQHIGTTGTSGTLYFTAPSTPGTYVFRLEDASQDCVNDNCITVAESNTVTVQ